jgi:hypothetical protein
MVVDWVGLAEAVVGRVSPARVKKAAVIRA